MTASMKRRTRHSERGAVAGLEGLMFAVMILLGGLTVVVNAWSVIDSRAALEAASREYLRSYTRQGDNLSARIIGQRAAEAVLSGRNAHFQGLRFEIDEPNGFGPCSVVTVRISAQVPTLRAPFIDGFASMRVTSTATELVDAYRLIDPSPSYSPDRTACFGG